MIQAVHELKRQIGLRIASIPFTEEWLAMQIRQFHLVGVDDRKVADARPGERRDNRAADAAGADNCDFRCFELALPYPADLRQDDVPRIAVELSVGKVHRPVEPKTPTPRLVSVNSAT